MDPFKKFAAWYSEEKKRGHLKLPAACCLSTNGLDGYPNARFVSLKELKDEAFIITGSLASRKGLELLEQPRAALSFWWTQTERQVRIQGDAQPISKAEAQAYFERRNRASKIVSTISKQGATIAELEVLQEKYQALNAALVDQNIDCPENWGGFKIQAIRIEFLQFQDSRFHERMLYSKENGVWVSQHLQP